MTTGDTAQERVRETYTEAQAKVPERAEIVLAYLRERGGTWRGNVSEIKAAVGFPAFRDVVWALDHLHGNGSIQRGRGNRWVVTDGT